MNRRLRTLTVLSAKNQSFARHRQPDEMDEKDVPLFETGVRAQLIRSLIGAIGVGIGLNRGAETPAFSLTVGFQFACNSGYGIFSELRYVN